MDDNDSTEDTPEDTPEEEKAGDGKAEDEKAEAGTDDGGGDGAEDDGPPTEERLDELGEHIDRARSAAEDAVEGVEAHEERFVDSGSEESKKMDDQTDAPG